MFVLPYLVAVNSDILVGYLHFSPNPTLIPSTDLSNGPLLSTRSSWGLLTFAIIRLIFLLPLMTNFIANQRVRLPTLYRIEVFANLVFLILKTLSLWIVLPSPFTSSTSFWTSVVSSQYIMVYASYGSLFCQCFCLLFLKSSAPLPDKYRLEKRRRMAYRFHVHEQMQVEEARARANSSNNVNNGNEEKNRRASMPMAMQIESYQNGGVSVNAAGNGSGSSLDIENHSGKRTRSTELQAPFLPIKSNSFNDLINSGDHHHNKTSGNSANSGLSSTSPDANSNSNSNSNDFLNNVEDKVEHAKTIFLSKLSHFKKSLNLTDLESKIDSHYPNLQILHRQPRSTFNLLVCLHCYENVIDELNQSYSRDPTSLHVYIPQLLTFLLYGAYNLNFSSELEGFILKKCECDVHFAHRVYWFLRAWSTRDDVDGALCDGNEGVNGVNGRSRSLSPISTSSTSSSSATATATAASASASASATAPSSSSSPAKLKVAMETFRSEDKVTIAALIQQVKLCGEGPASLLQVGRGPREKTVEQMQMTTAPANVNAMTAMVGYQAEGKQLFGNGEGEVLRGRLHSSSSMLSASSASSSTPILSPPPPPSFSTSLSTSLLTSTSNLSFPLSPDGSPSKRHITSYSAKHRIGFFPVSHLSNPLGSSSSTTDNLTCFNSAPMFIDSLIAIADALFTTPKENRTDELRRLLSALEIEVLPSNVTYLPVGNPRHRVWRIVPGESIAISTKERVPCIITMEVIEYAELDGEAKRLRKWWTKKRDCNRHNNVFLERFLSIKEKIAGAAEARIRGVFHMNENENENEFREGEGNGNEINESLFVDSGDGSGNGNDNDNGNGDAYDFTSVNNHNHNSSRNLSIVEEGSIESSQSASIASSPQSPLTVSRRTSRSASETGGVGLGQWSSPSEKNLNLNMNMSMAGIGTPPNSGGSSSSFSAASPALPLQRLNSVDSSPDTDTKLPSSPSHSHLESDANYGAFMSENQNKTPTPNDDPNDDQSDSHSDKNKNYPSNSNPSHLPSSFTNPVVFKEKWSDKESRLRSESAFGHVPGWRLCPVIIKSNDDLRQEQLASQLIKQMATILCEGKVPVWLCPYDIIAINHRAGVIEAVCDSISIDSLKRNYPNYTTLSNFFTDYFGKPGTDEHNGAKANFVESLAAYSVVCYILQLKDRHNGNILLDVFGHIVHIDFGFLFLSSPGGGFGFESAPFKLTREHVEMLDGPHSRTFLRYRDLCVRTFMELRRNAHKITMIVEMIAPGSEDLPCFASRPADALRELRERFKLEMTDNAFKDYVNALIDESVENWRTRWYDRYQSCCTGVRA